MYGSFYASEKLLEIHRKSYESVVNGGILLDHFMSLKHGLQFLRSFYDISENKNLIDAIQNLVSHVKQKLYSSSHFRKDESYVMKLDREYSDLREELKNVFIEPWIDKYQLIFSGSFRCYAFQKTSLVLCEIIEELVSSDCKADHISPVRKELEGIRKMLFLMEPFFDTKHEKDKKILSSVATLTGRVICFVYLSAVGKMDDEMVISLKNSSCDLMMEETQIMNMYLSLDVHSTKNLKSHISMSLRLLGWNKRCYLGTELGEALEDHFTSIEHGLHYLVKILKVSENEDLKMRVRRFIDIMKQKLYSLPHNQNDENLRLNLEHVYGELREEMKIVVMKPGTDDYDTLFPKFIEGRLCFLLEEIMELTLLKLASSSKADQIAPMMKDIEEFRRKLRSLKPLFNYMRIKLDSFFCLTQKSKEINVNFAIVGLTTFLDRAACLIYLSLVSKLNEDIFVSFIFVY